VADGNDRPFGPKFLFTLPFALVAQAVYLLRDWLKRKTSGA
jgi:hypothetical protein